VAVGGGYAYVTVGTRLLVFDVSTPHGAQTKGSETSVRDGTGIALQGAYAYVAVDSSSNAFRWSMSPTPSRRTASASVRVLRTAWA